METFLFAHVAAGAWSTGTATKYRQTLTALAARLAGTRVADDLAHPGTPAADLTGMAGWTLHQCGGLDAD